MFSLLATPVLFCTKAVKFTHLAVVVLLPFVGEDGADHSAGILDDHLPSLDVPLAEEAAAVDVRPTMIHTRRSFTMSQIFLLFFFAAVCRRYL